MSAQFARPDPLRQRETHRTLGGMPTGTRAPLTRLPVQRVAIGGMPAPTRLEAAIAELAAALREEIEASLEAPRAPQLLSIPEAARRAGISRTLIYSLIASGELRTVKVGRRRLVPEHELAALSHGTAAGVATSPAAEEERDATATRPPTR